MVRERVGTNDVPLKDEFSNMSGRYGKVDDAFFVVVIERWSRNFVQKREVIND